MEIVRRKRIRRLVSELNKKRRIQSRKIDLLCNDFVASHKNFLKQLQTMSAEIELYESLIGLTNLEDILDYSASAVQNVSGSANVAIWLDNSFVIHLYDQDAFTPEQADLIANCFLNSLAEKIYKNFRCMEIDELFEIGLPESQVLLKLSGAAIPLRDCNGFIFVYREAAHPLDPSTLSNISLLVPGISKAVKVCQKASQPA